MSGRGIWAHLALLGIATGASIHVWTRDKKPAAAATEVTVWNARPSDVARVSYESKTKRLVLEGKADAEGRWYLGTAEPRGTPDGGAPPAKTTFASVSGGEKIAGALAPLKALREIGRIEATRESEFGLKDSQTTLAVAVAGKERTLAVGDAAPGGGGRYARDEATGTVYALKDELFRDLESGEGMLTEREMHGFKDSDVRSVRIVSGDRKREIVRSGPESKRIWADPGHPEDADETFTNWMAKVDRLKPVEYLATEPTAPSLVVRLEVSAKGSQNAFFEIAKVPGNAGKSDFLVRSERTRLWAKTHASLGEQVEQDLGSVLK